MHYRTTSKNHLEKIHLVHISEAVTSISNIGGVPIMVAMPQNWTHRLWPLT